jgi:hypothetical protein
LLQLIREVYKTEELRVINGLLDQLMKKNPQIRNADLIMPGQTVFFPNVRIEMVEDLR